MDDEDSKLRRNLVLVSSLVLLFAWLQVPEGALLKRIFGELDATVAISPVRIWIAITALLIYLALRFRFSKEHEESLKELTLSWGVLEVSFLKFWLHCEARCFRWSGWATPLFGSFLQEWTKNSSIQSSTDRPAAPVVVTKVRMVEVHSGFKDEDEQWRDPKDGTWTVRVALEFCSEGGAREVSGIEKLVVLRTKPQRFLARIGQLCLLLAYSRSSTLLILPWVMAAVALCFCVFKLYLLL